MVTHYIMSNKMHLEKLRKHVNTSQMILLCFFLTKYDTNSLGIGLGKMMTSCYN